MTKFGTLTNMAAALMMVMALFVRHSGAQSSTVSTSAASATSAAPETSSSEPESTTPFVAISSPTQTEIEIWAISLTVCFVLGVVWFAIFITHRFQLCKHPNEAQIREMAATNNTFNRKALVEASNFLTNRLGTSWPKMATYLLKEHPEQPIVEYVNADMRGQPTVAKIECMMSKWKQLRGKRCNLNELLDCLYDAWHTRLVYDMCHELTLAASLAQYFGLPENVAGHHLTDYGPDEHDFESAGNSVRPSTNEPPNIAAHSNRSGPTHPEAHLNVLYDNTSPVRMDNRERRAAAIQPGANGDRGDKPSVVKFAEPPSFPLPPQAALDSNYSQIATIEPPPQNTKSRSRSSSITPDAALSAVASTPSRSTSNVVPSTGANQLSKPNGNAYADEYV